MADPEGQFGHGPLIVVGNGVWLPSEEERIMIVGYYAYEFLEMQGFSMLATDLDPLHPSW